MTATYKVIVIGDTGVGKTAMILKAATKSFPNPETLKSTIGVAHHLLKLDNGDQLVVWDFAGQQHFRSFLSSMFFGTHGGVFVFDISNLVSIDDLESFWIPEVQKVISINKNNFIIVGNKADLERKVDDDKIYSIAKKYGLDYILVSAKNDDIMEKVFKALYQKLKQ